MPREERPLTPAERAELERIRRNRAIKSARREIDSHNAIGKYIGGWIALFAVILLLAWPTLVWHKPDPSGGSVTLSTGDWIIEGVWLAIVLPIGGLILYANKKSKS